MSPEAPKEVSKPFVLIGVLVLLLIAGAFIPASWLGVKPQASAYTPIDFTQLSKIENYTNDADGNGEITWKELIASTDEGAQALAEGQNILPDPNAIELLNDPDNLTSSFTKKLYIASTYMENSGITDETSHQEALNQLVAEEAAKLIPKQYIYADIKVAASENAQSLRVYGNNLALVLENMITQDSIEKDAQGVADFMSTENKDALTPLVQDYKQMDEKIKQMLSISVPPSASSYHLIALNQMVAYRETLFNLSKAATDLMRANLVFKKYPETTIQTLLIYDRMAEYFNLKNVVFSSKEPGYIFTIGYTLK
jgi:hypothetical protein